MKFLRRTAIYKSIFLINQGNELAAQGMRTLGANSDLLGANYREAMLDLQHRRTLLNLQFLSEMQHREQTELTRIEQLLRNNGPADATNATPNLGQNPS